MHRKYAKHTKYVAAAMMFFLAATAVMNGCGKSDTDQEMSSGSETESSSSGKYDDLVTPGVNVFLTGDYSDKALNAEWDMDSATKIVFAGSSATVDGEKATVNGSIVTISQGGTYVLSGEGQQVQLVVEAGEEENVQIVLNGVTLENSNTAPIYIKSGKNAFLTLAEGTENTVLDKRAAYVETEASGETSAAVDTEETLEAAIYSEIDLILNGTGSLTVEAGYDDGIRTKDDMEIISGTYHVTSRDDGFVGKDSISVCDGNITVNAKGTALKSSKSDDLEKGFIVIDGGTFDLTAGDGDGLHAEYALVINDGEILIRDCEEGLEAMNILINGGNIELTSTDDGVNVSEAEEYAALFGNQSVASEEPTDETTGGNASDQAQQRPDDGNLEMEEAFAGRGFGGGMNDDGNAMIKGNATADHIEGALIITGGSLTVTAQGDGLDSNGDILIEGGTTIVSGPTSGGNGSLDYADTFDLTGGILAIAGNQGMEQSIISENVPVVTVSFDEKIDAGTEIIIVDSENKQLFSFVGNQTFSYVSFASTELTEDGTYTVTAGTVSKEGTAAIGLSGNMAGGQAGFGNRMQKNEMPENRNPEDGMSEGWSPDDKMQGDKAPGGKMQRDQEPNGETTPDTVDSDNTL